MGGIAKAVGGALGIGDAGGIQNSGLNLGRFRKAYDLLSESGPYDTGQSIIDPRTGQITIDPLTRSLQLGALGDFRSNISGLRERLSGNASPFTQARVAPYLRRFEAGRGALGRELGRTGVRGTIRDRSLQDYDIAGERELGNVRALAEADNLNALTSVDQAIFNADTGVATNLFNQELQALGLGADVTTQLKNLAVQLLTKQQTSSLAAKQAELENRAKGGENILGIAAFGLNSLGSGGSGGGANA